MLLQIAGVNHNDPLCRSRLIDWLKSLSTTRTTLPSFIAVEAAEQFYLSLLPQREVLRQLIVDEFPAVSSDVLDVLVASIYYEADTHKETFPESRVVWLDSATRTHRRSLDSYAKDRMVMYRPHLAYGDALARISEWAWSFGWERPPTTPLGDPDYNRDFRFYEKIKDAISSQDGDWAIVIVGSSHAAIRTNSMKQLLKQDGVSCVVEILKPSQVEQKRKLG